jgi:hypothetical protein
MATTSSARHDVLQDTGATFEPAKPVPPLVSPETMRAGGLYTRRPKRRLVLVQPAPVSPAPTPTVYRHGGRLFAEFSAVFWWFLFWAFNGGCTALSFATAAQWFGGKFYVTSPDWLSYWLMVPAGIIVHLMISTMEQHLWQSGRANGTPGERIAALSKLRIAEAVTVGSIDSLTTSWTIYLILIVLGATPSMMLNMIAALLGTAMALVPEPMLRYHGVGLKILAGR